MTTNIGRILESAGMSMTDLVRLDAFLVDPRDLATYMKVRDRHVAAPPPASTLVVVRALARPAFRVEVEAVAAADRVRRGRPVVVWMAGTASLELQIGGWTCDWQT